MSTQANLMEPSAVPSVVASIPWTRQMVWCVRREVWENRSIYVAPLVAGGLVLFGHMLSLITLPHRLRALDAAKQPEALESHFQIASGIIMVTAFVVGIFYSLEALQSERRDRSILFWKSLPVSDVTTVLAKLLIPLLVLPLLAFVILLAAEFVMFVTSSVVLSVSGIGVATLWSLPLFQRALMWLYHILTVHGLWYLPLYGWLLLVSAWARRVALIWAALPWVAIGVIEKIAFGSAHFGHFLETWIAGGPAGADPLMMPGVDSAHLMWLPALGRFLTSPGLWIGFALSAVFLTGAVRLRRYRGPN